MRAPTSSSAVWTRLAGTPNPVAMSTKFNVGSDRSSIRADWAPGLLPAPVRASSIRRIAYAELLTRTVVTFEFSRAWVHRDWIVYSALPSASIDKTGRFGAATAAPVATGMPCPIAPPVRVSSAVSYTHLRAHETVLE